MQDLGNLGWELRLAARRGMNDKGQLCGASEISVGGPSMPSFGTPRTPLPACRTWAPSPGGTSSNASGINSKGQVVGAADTAGGQVHAFLWDPKGPVAGLQDLGTLPGMTWSIATGINSKGQVCGYAERPTTITTVSSGTPKLRSWWTWAPFPAGFGVGHMTLTPKSRWQGMSWTPTASRRPSSGPHRAPAESSRPERGGRPGSLLRIKPAPCWLN